MSKSNAILVLNAGSASIKFRLFACPTADTLELVYRGDIMGIIGGKPLFTVNTAQGEQIVNKQLTLSHHEQALSILLNWLEEHQGHYNLIAAGHRVVHGGTLFAAPIRVDNHILRQLEQLIPLAPLHQPHNLAAIKALTRLKCDLPQVACFDTAFHRTQPAVAQAFALPHHITDMGIKRYGFHGLSYEYIVHSLPQFMGKIPERLVVAHLGNGVSMCAIKSGLSVTSTMGFSTLDGLPMGTRCGSIDVGVVLHLLDNGMDSKAIADILYHRSGLYGVSGISNDMRELLNSEAPQAKAAINLFVYRIGRELGSLAAALGGLDALVFTAGIGQHAVPIRARVCEDAAWLGIKLDTAANEQHRPKISATTSQVSVWVIPTDEEKMIAQHTYNCLNQGVTE